MFTIFYNHKTKVYYKRKLIPVISIKDNNRTYSEVERIIYRELMDKGVSFLNYIKRASKRIYFSESISKPICFTYGKFYERYIVDLITLQEIPKDLLISYKKYCFDISVLYK